MRSGGKGLARYLKQARRQPLLSLFDQVADDVKAQTGNQQRPTRYGDLNASTYLLASLAPAPDLAAAPASARPGRVDAPNTPSP